VTNFDLLFHTTQPISRNNAKVVTQLSNQFSVEIEITAKTMVRELINANKDLSHRIGERPWRSSSQFYAEKNGKARSASNEMQVVVCEEISF